jgi:hypothetical protein
LSLAADRPRASRTAALSREWDEGSAAESG